MAALSAWTRRFRRADDGAELIEMALVTPILLLLLAGIFDFGFLFRSWEVVTNAAREGARVGVLPSYGCADDGPAEERVVSYLTTSGISAPAAGDVVAGNATITTAAGDLTVCQVSVTVKQMLPSLGFATGLFGGSLTSVTLRGSSVMRTEIQAAPTP
jgi:Flp pilus assembly protein TadG